MASINQQKAVELVLDFVQIPTVAGNAKIHNLTFTSYIRDELQSNSAAVLKTE